MEWLLVPMGMLLGLIWRQRKNIKSLTDRVGVLEAHRDTDQKLSLKEFKHTKHQDEQHNKLVELFDKLDKRTQISSTLLTNISRAFKENNDE